MISRRDCLLGLAMTPAARFVHFETRLPEGISIASVTALDSERLVASVQPKTEEPAFVLSRDLGRSWQAAPMAAPEGRVHSLLRLKNGDLGMIYGKKELIKTASYSTPAQTFLFRWSADDGRKWSPGVPIDLPQRYEDEALGQMQNKGVFVTYPFGRLIQLSSGRLVLPCYWYFGGRHLELHPDLKLNEGPAYATVRGRRINRIADGHLYESAMGGCYVYYSDDLGKSWTRSTGSVMAWPLPGEDNVGGFGATWEPVLMELKDSRLLMYMRTNLGRLFQTTSRDGGDHWSPAEPTELASGDVPCSLGRLRKSGHVVVCWNQSTAAEIRAGYSRGRLCTAVSRDETKSWGHFKTVALSAGMPAVDRVPAPPVKHVRANRELGVLPDEFARHHYPQLAFIGEKALILYNTGKVQENGKMEGWRPVLRVVDEEWFPS